MTRAGRQDHDIAPLQRNRPSVRAAELHLDIPACDAQHLVRARVEVQIVINSVPPGILPAVRCEERLENGRGVESGSQDDGCSIKQQREIRIVGRFAVVLESESVWLAGTNQGSGIPGPAIPRRFFEYPPGVFQNLHACTVARCKNANAR